MLELRELSIPGVLEIKPRKFGDARGFFSETWSVAAMEAAGLDFHFVQDNHSYSAARGVVRGLHFQLPPMAQDKLVRVSRGSIFDVVVDIRKGSPTYGKWAGLTLSAAAWNQILVPKGFAHGFATLEDHTEVQYKVTAAYSPEHEKSVYFNDPDLAIDWPETPDEVQLSAKDRDAPPLRDLETGFTFEC